LQHHRLQYRAAIALSRPAGVQYASWPAGGRSGVPPPPGRLAAVPHALRDARRVLERAEASVSTHTLGGDGRLRIEYCRLKIADRSGRSVTRNLRCVGCAPAPARGLRVAEWDINLQYSL